MGETLKKSEIIPALFSQMIAIGESSGSMDVMLARLADYAALEAEKICRDYL